MSGSPREQLWRRLFVCVLDIGHPRRLTQAPFADSVVVLSLIEVDMEMFGVKTIRSRTENRVKALASRRLHQPHKPAATMRAAALWPGDAINVSARRDEGLEIHGVAYRMFAEFRAFETVARAAFISADAVDCDEALSFFGESGSKIVSHPGGDG